MTYTILSSGRAYYRNVGGNSTYLRNLAESIKAHGYNYSFIAPRRASGKLGALEDAFGEGLSPMLSRGDHQLVHYPTDTGAFPGSGRRTPVVATVHGIASAHVSGIRRPAAEAIWRKRVKWCIDAADHVITVSSSSADDLVRVFSIPSAKISVISHGIDVNRFHPTVDPVPRNHNLKDPYFLYLGNLDPRKNVQLLADTFSRPAIRKTGVRLVVAGRQAWGSKDLARQLDEQENVTVVGAVPDDHVPVLMARSRGVLFPSLYEGFGFPVLEALACGAVVACSRRGSLKDLVPDGLAYSLEPLTPEHCERVILEIIDLRDGDQSPWRVAGIKYARTFSWERSAKAHASIFDDLVG